MDDSIIILGSEMNKNNNKENKSFFDKICNKVQAKRGQRAKRTLSRCLNS